VRPTRITTARSPSGSSWQPSMLGTLAHGQKARPATRTPWPTARRPRYSDAERIRPVGSRRPHRDGHGRKAWPSGEGPWPRPEGRAPMNTNGTGTLVVNGTLVINGGTVIINGGTLIVGGPVHRRRAWLHKVV